jgi:hypothetical protein
MQALSEQIDEGWSVKELWEKYENIAMHFNDLLIKLRTQALGAVAAISTLVGIFSGSGTDNKVRWELAAAVLLFLCFFWIAVWIIDFFYYNRLLIGAVDAILDLEKLSTTVLRIRTIDISSKIELAVDGKSPRFDKESWWKFWRRFWRCRGICAFYVIVFLALITAFFIAYWAWHNECRNPQPRHTDTTCGRVCAPQLSTPSASTPADTSGNDHRKEK